MVVRWPAEENLREHGSRISVHTRYRPGCAAKQADRLLPHPAGNPARDHRPLLGLVAALITLAAWFVILFTGKYPAGMSSFVVNVLHWCARVSGYMYLLTGKYPPFSMGPDTSYPVRFAGEAQPEGRNRLTVFFRVIMIIPHAIILYFLQIAAEVVIFIAWFAALFTGSVPAGMHNFVAGFLRWYMRYYAYAALLTDEYPPFSLS